MTAASLPRQRTSTTTSVSLDGYDGRMTVGETDGQAHEVHLMLGSHGTAVAGLADAIGTAVTLGLAHGAPAERFTPALALLGLREVQL